MKQSNPNPDNNEKQTTGTCGAQAENSRSGLPRPKRATGKSGIDPVDYAEHPYPSMRRLAQHLVPCHDTVAIRRPRTSANGGPSTPAARCWSGLSSHRRPNPRPRAPARVAARR